MSSDDNFPDGFDDLGNESDNEQTKPVGDEAEDVKSGTVWEEAVADSCEERAKIASSPSQVSGMVKSEDSQIRSQQVDGLAESITSGATIIDENIVNDIEVEIQIVAGVSKMRLGDLLKLNQGSAIETTSLKDDPFLMICNGKIIGGGDLCFINEQRGIKLTELVSDKDRLSAKKNI